MIEQDFRKRLRVLRWGIVVAWFFNIVVTTLTVEASLIVIFLSTSSTNEEIFRFLLLTSPISLIVSFVVVAILSFFATRRIPASTSEDLVPASKFYPQVQNVVEEMCVAAGLPHNRLPEVFVARDVSTPNAYAVSWGKDSSRIVFTAGIVSILNREELQAVAAHELGHITSGDSNAMTKLVAMASLVGFISGLFSRFFYTGNNRGNGNNNPIAIILILTSFIFLLFAPLLSTVSQAFMSRKRESSADATAVDYSRNPTALISALRKISSVDIKDSASKKFMKSAKHLAFYSPKVLRTHPPTEDRVRALVAMGGNISE